MRVLCVCVVCWHSLHYSFDRTQKGAINNRLDFIELLLGNGDAFFELSARLPKCPDLEYIVASCLVQIPKYGTQVSARVECMHGGREGGREGQR